MLLACIVSKLSMTCLRTGVLTTGYQHQTMCHTVAQQSCRLPATLHAASKLRQGTCSTTRQLFSYNTPTQPTSAPGAPQRAHKRRPQGTSAASTHQQMMHMPHLHTHTCHPPICHHATMCDAYVGPNQPQATLETPRPNALPPTLLKETAW
jgi:hypothetical protein